MPSLSTPRLPPLLPILQKNPNSSATKRRRSCTQLFWDPGPANTAEPKHWVPLSNWRQGLGSGLTPARWGHTQSIQMRLRLPPESQELQGISVHQWPINPRALQNPSPNPVSDVELGEPVGGTEGATGQGAPTSSRTRSLPSLLAHLYAWTGTLSFKEDCSVSKTRCHTNHQDTEMPSVTS